MFILCRFSPDFTTEEILQGYRSDLCRGKVNNQLELLIQSVIASQSMPASKDSIINLQQIDSLELDYGIISNEISDFCGADLVSLDISRVTVKSVLFGYVKFLNEVLLQFKHKASVLS